MIWENFALNWLPPGEECQPLDDVRLANYIAGIDPGPIEAGRVYGPIALALRVRPGTPVLLSDYTMTKTSYRHGEVTFQDYMRLPSVLASGFAVPGRLPRTVEFAHFDYWFRGMRWWHAVIKATVREEVYVTLFHRSNLGEARRIYRRAAKRGEIIRDVEEQLARTLRLRAS